MAKQPDSLALGSSENQAPVGSGTQSRGVVCQSTQRTGQRFTAARVARIRSARTAVLSLEEAAYFLQMSVRQATHEWMVGRLPHVILDDASQFVLDKRGSRLVSAPLFRQLLGGRRLEEAVQA